MRSKTVEEVYVEMLKPKDGVRLKVQYRPEEFAKVKGLPGDSFYIRCQWPGVPGIEDQGRGIWWRLFPINVPILASKGLGCDCHYLGPKLQAHGEVLVT